VNAFFVHTVPILLVPLLVSSGWWDFEAELPNGYGLVRTNSSSVFIVAPEPAHKAIYGGRWAVPSKIVGINVQEDIVFGQVELSPEADGGYTGPPGFFLLDTKTHTARLGPEESVWSRSLESVGVERRSLRRPGSLRELSDQGRGLIGTLLTVVFVVVGAVVWASDKAHVILLVVVAAGGYFIWRIVGGRSERSATKKHRR
jgi:hypothetical protein